MKFPINAQDLIVAGAAMNDDGFDPEIRRKYMNASEAMTCIRKQWYYKHQPYAGDPETWGYANRGHGVERFVVESLTRSLPNSLELRLAGDDQCSLYSDEHRISATPDGVFVDHANEVLWGCEFKSIDPRTNRKHLPRDYHTAQLQIGMALLDRVKVDMGLPDWPIAGGVICYTDASNWDDTCQFPVPFDGKILDRLARRASQILNTRKVARLPREGKSNGGKECKTMCPFQKICGVDVAEASGSARANRGSRLDTAVVSYMQAKEKEAAAKADKDEAGETIKNELRARKAASLTVGGHEVSLSKVAGRTTLDRKAVEAAGIDLSPFEKVGAPSERLTVK